MDFINLFADYSPLILSSLVVLAFTAGFIDAIVGGGGFIQLPALLVNFPNTVLPTLMGTNKIAGFSGTFVSAIQYGKRIKFDYQLLIFISVATFVFSYLGASVVSYLNSEQLKPVILLILIVMAIYTFIKKDLGQLQSKSLSQKRKLIYGLLLGAFVGFYDGFFGPGAGSFLVLGFVMIFGFEFIMASAYSKFINCVSNFGALYVFISQWNYLLEIALLMAACNITGSLIGTKMAFKKGNGFIRILFLVIVSFLILRYAYDIFLK
ncbi:MAG: hypothetical protein RL516_1911 [Bacteroidota bacterium]|jgi:uncharacterized membrane protein YfcA